MSALDDAVERLRGDMAAALGRDVEFGDIVAVAVSGGPDSMALLALTRAAWPGQVIAATVDHGLRAEAVAEAAMAAEHCAGVSVPHATLRPAAPLGTSNVQASARTARYALLTGWATENRAALLVTAHHGDDQAETFLMRAARGSGLSGLAAIRPRQALSNTVTLVRPLLGWRRGELRAIAEALQLPFVDDPSNASDRHDRTRFRALLAQSPLLDPVRIARSAAYLADADADLRAIEAWLLDTRSQPADPPACRIDVAGLPREMRRRLARAAILRVRDAADIAAPAFSDATNIEPLLDALDEEKSATQAGVMVTPDSGLWHFRPAPPRRGE